MTPMGILYKSLASYILLERLLVFLESVGSSEIQIIGDSILRVDVVLFTITSENKCKLQNAGNGGAPSYTFRLRFLAPFKRWVGPGRWGLKHQLIILT
jgi:hypothetical protein